ncbi:MAG: hypothetical protein ACREF9_03780 [Opitutaceae bacterium]
MNEPAHSFRCSTRAMRYWTIVTLLGWTALGVVGMWWHPLRFFGAPAILLAVSAGCFANWIRNRTCHCLLSAPLLLVAGVAFLLSDLRIVAMPASLVWLPLAIGVGIAFLLEWRLARRD